MIARVRVVLGVAALLVGARVGRPGRGSDRRRDRARVKVATANANEQRKQGLVRRLLPRARGVLAALRDEGVSLAVVQESGTWLGLAARHARDFAASYGIPNTVVRGMRRGNGIVYDPYEWRMLRGRWRLTVDIPNGSPKRGRKPGTRRLTIPIRSLEHRETGIRVWVVAVHKPRNVPMYHDSRRVLDQRLKAWCDEHKHDLVILAGDFNGRPPALPGLQVVADHGVDTILASRSIDAELGVDVIPLRRRNLSDHDAVARVLTLTRPNREAA